MRLRFETTSESGGAREMAEDEEELEERMDEGSNSEKRRRKTAELNRLLERSVEAHNGYEVAEGGVETARALHTAGGEDAERQLQTSIGALR